MTILDALMNKGVQIILYNNTVSIELIYGDDFIKSMFMLFGKTIKSFGFLLIMLVMLFSVLCSCKEQSGERETEKENPTPVQVVEVKAVDLPYVVETVGRLTPDREVVLAAEVPGVIKSYDAEMGDVVEAGRLLVEIDPRDYELALDEAEANHVSALARYNASLKAYERARSLYPRKVISQERLDSAEAEFRIARAAMGRTSAMVDTAGERLKKTRVVAPFAGHIAARMVEVGQTVAPGTPLISLVNLEKIRVKVYLAESDYVHLDKNDRFSVMLDVLPGKVFEGRPDRIGVKADPRTNTFEVELLIDNKDFLLKAGLSARVKLTTRVISSAVLIPESAVLYREDRKEVYLADDKGKAVLRPVELGVTAGSDIQVVQGLKPGDRLVIVGGQYLSPGKPLKIISETPSNTGE